MDAPDTQDAAARSRRPRRSSRATRRSSRRPTRATIRSSWRAARAPWSRTWTATSSSTAPPASPSTPPATRIPTSSSAITEQAQQFLHMSGTDFYYEPQVRLAEELAAIAPIAGAVRSFFGNSGTEAIEAAHQAGAATTEAPQHHRVPRRVPRPHDGVAVADREQGRCSGAASGRWCRACTTRRTPNCYRCPVGLDARDSCAAECLRLHRGADPRAPRRRPTKSPRSSSSRSRARAATSCRPTAFHAAAARADHASTACCWSSTKCSRAWAAPGRCSRSSTPASQPDIVDDGEGHRVGAAARRGDRARGGDVVAAGRAREHVRRQPGVVRRGARDDQAAARAR